MLVMSLSPLWTVSLVGVVLIVGIVSLIVVSEKQLTRELPHDPEREIQRLTYRLRHPFRARLSRWTSVE